MASWNVFSVKAEYLNSYNWVWFWYLTVSFCLIGLCWLFDLLLNRLSAITVVTLECSREGLKLYSDSLLELGNGCMSYCICCRVFCSAVRIYEQKANALWILCEQKKKPFWVGNVFIRTIETPPGVRVKATNNLKHINFVFISRP